MQIRKILLFVALGAILGGCTTMTPQERRAADEKTCLSYGFRRNTDALATCLQRIDLDRVPLAAIWQRSDALGLEPAGYRPVTA